MTTGLHTAYLSLGSNQGDRAALLQQAAALLGERAGELRAVSSLYQTQPWGFDSPHPFLNAALCLQTPLSPEELLQTTQQIEKELGRIRHPRQHGYADRKIDIDILLYDDEVISTPELTIPHPGIAEREFVLTPLCEVLRQRPHPVLGLTMGELRDNLLRKTK